MIAVGPEALGITLLPRFSQMMVQGGHSYAGAFLKRFLAAAMAGSAIVAGSAQYWLSRPIVKLVFRARCVRRRGRLSPSSPSRTCSLLPGNCPSRSASRFSIRFRRLGTYQPYSGSDIRHVRPCHQRCALNLLLMREFAVAGIALATAIAQAAVFAILLAAVTRILRRREVTSDVLKTAGARSVRQRPARRPRAVRRGPSLLRQTFHPMGYAARSQQ